MILLALLLSACATAPAGSKAFRQLPILQAEPIRGLCRVASEPKPCVAVLEVDWQALVIWAKGSCLAHGGTREACQAE